MASTTSLFIDISRDRPDVYVEEECWGEGLKKGEERVKVKRGREGRENRGKGEGEGKS